MMNDVLSFSTIVDHTRALPAEVAIVLGSGMNGVAERCRTISRLPFAQVPGLTETSVVGHAGCLTVAEWGGKQVLLFEGRLHHYEGHPWRSVTEPIHIAHFLGARILLLTNAAGGIHDALAPGSLMAIRDHIEWTRPYCWSHSGCPSVVRAAGGVARSFLPFAQRAEGRAGEGERDSARPLPYSPRLLQILIETARGLRFDLPSGVYGAVTGPCYETPAEIRALKNCGADAVGMSTAREIEAGHELGMECAAVSCITNRAAGLGTGPINHEEVLSMAAAQAERLSKLLEGWLQRLEIPMHRSAMSPKR
jgi:purine-nucleoside phosphorylase